MLREVALMLIGLIRRNFKSFLLFLIVLVALFVIHKLKRDFNIIDYQHFLETELKENSDSKSANAVASALFSSVKILCLINSSKKQILNRAIHVNATWAKKCNKHIFLTYEENIDLPFLNLNINETRRNLWDKWRAALKWAYENEIDNYDFFLRADDDAYFIMENLRFMLLPFDPSKAYIFGERFKLFVMNGYMSGGAGVIFSKEALRRLAEAFYRPDICPEVTEGDDDIEIGACAERLKITNVDTRDHLGRHRMLAWSPDDYFRKGLNADQIRYLFYPFKENGDFSCCAKYMISFHYVYKELMYAFEFLIYNVKVIGNIDDLWLNANSYDTNMPLIQQLKYLSNAILMNNSTTKIINK